MALRPGGDDDARQSWAREKEKKNILPWPQPRRRLRWAFSSD
jgi:hypothetical protein